MREEKIYDLLNGMKMNLNEYDEQQLSSKEKQQIQKRLLQEVRKMKEGNKKTEKRAKRRLAAAGMAAAACAALTLTVSSSAQAKDFLSSTFQKLIAGTSGEKDAESYQELYTKIGSRSDAVTEKTGTDILKAEDAGVSLRACDVYCDGYMLYYTLELKAEGGELDGEAADGILTGYKNSGPNCGVTMDGKQEQYPMSFQKQKDGTFLSMQSYCFYADENPKQYKDGDVIPMEIHISRFFGFDYDQNDADGEYMQTGAVKGSWKLSFPVTVKTSGNVTQKINKEDGGVKLVSVTKAKATLNLVLEEPDYSKEPYNDPYNDPEISITGEDGQFLQQAGSYDEQREDGTHIRRISLIDTGDETFRLQAVNKNKGGEKIADIEFHVKR